MQNRDFVSQSLYFIDISMWKTQKKKSGTGIWFFGRGISPEFIYNKFLFYFFFRKLGISREDSLYLPSGTLTEKISGGERKNKREQSRFLSEKKIDDRKKDKKSPSTFLDFLNFFGGEELAWKQKIDNK